MSWDPVYRLVKQIPRGRVITYGKLAAFLRLRGGARAAGHAMAACPAGGGIPWHRVVGAGGRLLIREPFAALQRKLLESEGVHIRNGSVNLKETAWFPRSSRGGSSGRGSASRRKGKRGGRFARKPRV